MEHDRRDDLQLLERIRGCLRVAPRQVQIDRRVRQISVAQQQLDGPQIGARFEQMRRVTYAAVCAA